MEIIDWIIIIRIKSSSPLLPSSSSCCFYFDSNPFSWGYFSSPWFFSEHTSLLLTLPEWPRNTKRAWSRSTFPGSVWSKTHNGCKIWGRFLGGFCTFSCSSPARVSSSWESRCSEGPTWCNTPSIFLSPFLVRPCWSWSAELWWWVLLSRLSSVGGAHWITSWTKDDVMWIEAWGWCQIGWWENS